ncbi:hypothetical protein N008_10330 [Hymenobacter sp. APR13]|nr:hypothetical protein N008_10330 [Hymenobacter sp. APR13]
MIEGPLCLFSVAKSIVLHSVSYKVLPTMVELVGGPYTIGVTAPGPGQANQHIACLSALKLKKYVVTGATLADSVCFDAKQWMSRTQLLPQLSFKSGLVCFSQFLPRLLPFERTHQFYPS